MKKVEEVLKIPTQPVFEACKEKTSCPKVIFKQKGDQGWGLFIQWTGDFEGNTEQDQFLFPVVRGPHTKQCEANPDVFEVVFIGKIGDWLNPEARQQIADQIAGGDTEQVIAYFLSSHFKNEHEGSFRMASFLVRIVLLGDPNVGVISPLSHFDPDALKQERDNFDVEKAVLMEYRRRATFHQEGKAGEDREVDITITVPREGIVIVNGSYAAGISIQPAGDYWLFTLSLEDGSFYNLTDEQNPEYVDECDIADLSTRLGRV